MREPDSVLVAAFRRYADQALRSGITSIQDMADEPDPATTLRVLRLAGLPIRVRVVPMPGTDAAGRHGDEWRVAMRDSAWRASASEFLPTGAQIAATKWILDGTGIERLSLLRAPYADRPAWAGQVNFPEDTLRVLLREALVAGEQPILHAIGDSTIALLLSTMEALAPDSVWRRLRPRLEHAERRKGTLASGMLADLAVFSQNIFTVKPEAIPSTTSMLTLVGGIVAFDALTRVTPPRVRLR